MRLVIDVDKQHKKLFLEAAKAAKARVKIDKQYLTEEEEDKAMVKLIEEASEEGHLNPNEQSTFEKWLFVDRHQK